MIRLTSFIHRRELKEIVNRWLLNRPREDDAHRIKEIINFNSIFLRRYVRTFADDVFTTLFGERPMSRNINKKGQLKDFITAHPQEHTPRIDELIGAYNQRPYDFFRETPIDGRIFFVDRPGQDRFFVGSVRLKRFRRIAEKSSRRIIDFMYEQIKARASALAAARARAQNVSLDALITPPSMMEEEFRQAEDNIKAGLRTGTIDLERWAFEINDVAGMKVVGPPELQAQVIEYVDSRSDCTLMEKEVHSGTYNATNLLVKLTPDREAILDRPINAITREILASRGLRLSDADSAFRHFVEGDQSDVTLEIILSDYTEFMESELGRCMHENRIADQRAMQIYRGHMAKNVEYLMTFLFGYALSPETELGTIPIQVWSRYTADYFDEVLRRLFHVYTLTIGF